jgi:predicted nuclease of predicted toxin-antitoxin system
LPRILIDENLSPTLPSQAHKRGYESTHVNHLGLAGAKDWELRKIIIEDDWTFVTNNSIDFRGPAIRPGSTGEYADVWLHAGLVCINAPSGMNLEVQCRLFELVLDDLDKKGDLTNQVLEVSLKKSGEVILRRTSLPENA